MANAGSELLAGAPDQVLRMLCLSTCLIQMTALNWTFPLLHVTVHLPLTITTRTLVSNLALYLLWFWHTVCVAHGQPATVLLQHW